MYINIFENVPVIHTETILLDEDILGMRNSINNNIELRDYRNATVDDIFDLLFLDSKNIKLTQETTRYTEEGIEWAQEGIREWEYQNERLRQLDYSPDTYDPMEMYAIENNIELTTDSTMKFSEQELGRLKDCLQNVYKDYTKEEIIALAQKIIIEEAQSQ